MGHGCGFLALCPRLPAVPCVFIDGVVDVSHVCWRDCRCIGGYWCVLGARSLIQGFYCKFLPRRMPMCVLVCFGAEEAPGFVLFWSSRLVWFVCLPEGVSGVVGVCWELEVSSGGFTPPDARVCFGLCFSEEAPR